MALYWIVRWRLKRAALMGLACIIGLFSVSLFWRPDAHRKELQRKYDKNFNYGRSAFSVLSYNVRFFYDELWDMMTPTARTQTDNSDWKMVALTCDDGAGYSYSPKALTNFRRAGVRVTYFTVGVDCEENPDILMRQHDQNHIIACHTYSHRSGHALKEETRIKEVQKHTDLMHSIIGEGSHLFRAPGGTYPPWIESQTGMPILQWSVDTYDYTGKSPERIFYSIRNNVMDGDIILMHDTGKYLHKAVPIFTEWLWDNGYMMVTVEELARMNGVSMQPDTVYFRFLDGQTDVRLDSNMQ
jgi:peptidoglycan/xylan/chitin deacetylase (PgdA/CDA1 family)